MRNLIFSFNPESETGVIEIDGGKFNIDLPGSKKLNPEGFSLSLENFYRVKVTHPDVYDGWVLDTTPETPELIPLPFEEGGEFIYNDGIGSRSRHPMCIIACRNHLFKFKGVDIPGVCIVEKKDYTKNGKWSNTTYYLRLAKGFRGISLMQGFDSGKFVNDVTSLKKIASELGCGFDIFPFAIEEFLKRDMWKTYISYMDYCEKLNQMQEFEEKQGGEYIPYQYEQKTRVNREGEIKLLINGEIFDGVEDSQVKIVSKLYSPGHRGGVTYWKLMIHSSATIEEVPEYNPYDENDDSLVKRGFVLKDCKWVKPEPNTDNNPFASFFKGNGF